MVIASRTEEMTVSVSLRAPRLPISPGHFYLERGKTAKVLWRTERREHVELRQVRGDIGR